MTATKLTRTAKEKLLAKIETLTSKIRELKYTESLGSGSPTSTMDMDIIRRENGNEAFTERLEVEKELHKVAQELLDAGLKLSTINSYSCTGDVVGMIGTGEWVETGFGRHTEVKAPTVLKSIYHA